MKKRLIGLALMLVAALVVWQVTARVGNASETTYQFVEVSRSDVESTIAATGTLEAVGTVDVGTQVSGTMADVFADYNDHVERGQVLAVLDTTLLAASVTEAEAGLKTAEAKLFEARSEYSRTSDMHEQGYVSDAEFEAAQAGYLTAEASVVSAEASLKRAKANYGYAVIESPISGTIIERSIEEGQTVSASLSAPTLFIIAEDLAEMEIHVLVDESDIGKVAVDQDVRFTVEAYPDDEFTGSVQQIRLQPETVSNVVNYTVVVNASNHEGLLLPGMTATADFVVDSSDDVLTLANAALRFEPTVEMIEEMRETRMAGVDGGDAGERAFPGEGERPEGAGDADAGRERPALSEDGMPEPPDDLAMLWYLDDSGELQVIRAEKGISNGKITEVSGEGLAEGLEIISAASGTSVASAVESGEGPGVMGGMMRMGGGSGPPPRG